MATIRGNEVARPLSTETDTNNMFSTTGEEVFDILGTHYYRAALEETSAKLRSIRRDYVHLVEANIRVNNRYRREQSNNTRLQQELAQHTETITGLHQLLAFYQHDVNDLRNQHGQLQEIQHQNIELEIRLHNRDSVLHCILQAMPTLERHFRSYLQNPFAVQNDQPPLIPDDLLCCNNM